ncbi:MAG: EF-hand domain-containing protein [Limimaricola soesokkakensis]|uniref:EF-hand domain-containing protein n=1 Tax=Limimaricola soesokkakensis TaxID=1343159 RepID=UPI004058A5F0
MTPKTLLPAAFLVTALLGAGAAIATAQSQPAAETPESATTQTPERPGVIERIRAGFGGKGGHRHHGRPVMLQQIIEQADTNEDGALTRAEIDAFRAAQVESADASGDGALEIAEFETLYNAFTRERMVDAFQALDADGDGRISEEEMESRIDRLVSRLDRDGDGAIGPADRGRR